MGEDRAKAGRRSRLGGLVCPKPKGPGPWRGSYDEDGPVRSVAWLLAVQWLPGRLSGGAREAQPSVPFCDFVQVQSRAAVVDDVIVMLLEYRVQVVHAFVDKIVPGVPGELDGPGHSVPALGCHQRPGDLGEVASQPVARRR